MDKRIVIGRGEDCDLPINDTSVSRVHAEIHQIEGGQYEVLDRDSSNGVRVNGVELKRTILDAGDVVELGDVQLKFVPAGQVFHLQEAVAARRNSLEPGVGDRPDAGKNRTRAIAAVGLLAVIGVVAAVALRGRPSEPVPAASAEVSPAARALEEARVLLAQGDVEGALSKSQQIPEDSNLRESTIWKEIQARWADSIFDQAAREADRTQKRALLDLIAKSPDVGSIARKRAANEIAKLDADSVGIEDLPTADKQRDKTEDEPNTGKKPEPRNQAASPPAVERAVQPAAAPPKRKNDVKGGLVRETPF
jgi:hypothetical protein